MAPAHRLLFLAVLCLAGSVSKMPPPVRMPLLSVCLTSVMTNNDTNYKTEHKVLK